MSYWRSTLDICGGEDGPDVQNLMDLLHLLIFIVVMGKGEKKMPKYFDADKIELKGISVFDQNLEMLIPLSDVRKALQMTPTADVQEVRHGRWISNDLGGYKWAYYCSECGWVDGYPFNDRHKYCPNCGAKMDGEREIDTNKG